MRTPTAGAQSPLEAARLTRGGACRICTYCGNSFIRPPRSERITCSKQCANRQRIHDRIKPEYWWLNYAGYLEGNVWINGKRRRVRQHRWVMENHLGRKLTRWEHVHHKDGNRLNNDISNLEILDHVEHALIHNAENRKKYNWNPRESEVRRIGAQSLLRKIRRESQNAHD